jgi:multidrug resistance protein, MATE family
MSGSRPIPSREAASASSEFLSASLASSFRAASPIAHEIVAQDVEAYYTEDEAVGDDDDLDDGADSSNSSAPGGGHGPTLYREPSGIAFVNQRPSMVPDLDDQYHHAPPVLTRVEKKQSRAAERSLLRDNHLLPPKHLVEPAPSLARRVYKTLFSTKVGAPTPEDDGPRDRPSETTPLLVTPGEGLVPGGGGDVVHEHEHLDDRWEAAVASGKLQTTWQREAQTIGKYSRSLIMTFVLQYSVSIASVFAVGHIGTVELGAVSCTWDTSNPPKSPSL